MKKENGKFVELTEKELTNIYLDQGWYECYSLIEFKLAMERSGCKIIENENYSKI